LLSTANAGTTVGMARSKVTPVQGVATGGDKKQAKTEDKKDAAAPTVAG